jgi:hypothetical protein
MARVFKTGITSEATITGSSIVKSGGTSSQFLKADGSVDSSTYLSSTVDLTLNRVGGSEGGQVNFQPASTSGSALSWSIDSYGSGDTPDLRFIEGTNERARLTTGGGLTVGGVISTQGKRIFIQSGTPASPVAGDVWIWY